MVSLRIFGGQIITFFTGIGKNTQSNRKALTDDSFHTLERNVNTEIDTLLKTFYN